MSRDWSEPISAPGLAALSIVSNRIAIAQFFTYRRPQLETRPNSADDLIEDLSWYSLGAQLGMWDGAVLADYLSDTRPDSIVSQLHSNLLAEPLEVAGAFSEHLRSSGHFIRSRSSNSFLSAWNLARELPGAHSSGSHLSYLVRQLDDDDFERELDRALSTAATRDYLGRISPSPDWLFDGVFQLWNAHTVINEEASRLARGGHYSPLSHAEVLRESGGELDFPYDPNLDGSSLTAGALVGLTAWRVTDITGSDKMRLAMQAIADTLPAPYEDALAELIDNGYGPGELWQDMLVRRSASQHHGERSESSDITGHPDKEL